MPPPLPPDRNLIFPPPPDPAFQQPIAPVHLSAFAQLQAGAASGVPVATLKNPMGQDMELLEIKFQVIGDIDNGGQILTLGGSVGCEFTMGNYKLTAGSVPVFCFGRAENLSGEMKEAGSVSNLKFCAYTWRLPRPLFIPAGAVLQPRLNHFGYISSPLYVRIGYSGRTVFHQPKTIYLPWVAGWNSKVFNPVASASNDQSQPTHLINSTNQVFHLQRFVGRTHGFTSLGVPSEQYPISFGSRYLKVRMNDSYGRPILRTFTPFRSVFGALTRSWELEELDARLDPGAFYRVFLKKDAMTMAAGQEAVSAQAFVSMVGWRDIPVADFGAGAGGQP